MPTLIILTKANIHKQNQLSNNQSAEWFEVKQCARNRFRMSLDLFSSVSVQLNRGSDQQRITFGSDALHLISLPGRMSIRIGRHPLNEKQVDVNWHPPEPHTNNKRELIFLHQSHCPYGRHDRYTCSSLSQVQSSIISFWYNPQICIGFLSDDTRMRVLRCIWIAAPFSPSSPWGIWCMATGSSNRNPNYVVYKCRWDSF